MAILPCGDLKVGKVTWSRDVKGHQVSILSTDDGKIIRHMHNNNYSSLPDLSLIIWFVSSWDEGLYYCNGTSVACLTVKPADGRNIEDLTKCLKAERVPEPQSQGRESPVTHRTQTSQKNGGADHADVMEQVLMFGGVGLAALMFLFATAAAVKTLYCIDSKPKQRTLNKDHVQINPDYINLNNSETVL
ncbi:uncharacterized protein isoform X2 [Danio rerio]